MVRDKQQQTNKRDQTIHLRCSRQERDIIDQAARVVGKSRSKFMMEAASREAVNVLVDGTVVTLDAAAFDQFQDMLDAPPLPTDALRKLLLTKAPWE